MNTLLVLAFILLLGFLGVVGLIGVIALLGRRPDYNSVAALEAFDRRVATWVGEGRLDIAQADLVRELIRADRAKLLGWAPPPPKPQVAGAGGQEATVKEPAIAQAPAAAPIPPPPPAPVPAQPTLAATIAPLPAAGPRPPDPGHPTPAPRRAPPNLLSALMALATRRTLLFLGSFLLAVSALTLVIFNWASFPPIIQFGLLAAVTGGLWAGGTWMGSRPDLATAGRNLQAVAALLVPVVAFALTRPGLLGLAPRDSWLTVSLLSLPLYLLAAWRTERGFYSFSAAIAGVSAVLAVQSGVALEWLAMPLLLLLIGYVVLAQRLRSHAPALAAGPWWVAHIGLPLAVLAELLLSMNGLAGSAALSGIFGLATIFYVTVAWLDPRPIWALLAGLLLPAAVCLGLDAAGLPERHWPPALAILALAYLGVGVGLEGRRQPLARPVILLMPILAVAALLPALADPAIARTTLVPLIALSGLLVALVERGRLEWAGALRYRLATAGMAAAALLLPGWLWALLGLGELSLGVRALIVMPLAAAGFACARWWPGRLRRGYDLTLQAAGVLIALSSGASILLDEQVWVPGALLLAAIWAFQASIRPRPLWPALALGSALSAGFLALARSPELAATWWIWAGVAYTVAYAIGGSLLRHGRLRHWTWPALGWALFAGLSALANSTTEILLNGSAGPAESLAILALAGTLALMSWIWRRGQPGYPAAALLVAGVLLAAQRGFYTGWVPADGDLALVACALTAALGMLGQGLRARTDRSYALPYEQAGLALLTAAPLMAGSDPAHLCLTWLAMAGLYGLATWRYSLPWLLAAAWVTLDLGLLQGSAWLFPGGPAEGASLILLAAVAVQSLSALWLRRSVSSLLLGAHRLPGAPTYTAAAIGGVGALLIAISSDAHLAGVALGLAAILATVATGEKNIPAPWGALGLLAIGLASLHRALGLGPLAGLTWGMAEALALYGAGWAAAGRPQPRWQLWRLPLRVFPALAGLATGLTLAIYAGTNGDTGYVALACAGTGLLLALAARRERQPWLYTAALASGDLAVLALALWLRPALVSPQLVPIMLVAAAIQAAGAIWLRQRAAGSGRHTAGLPIYAAAGISAALALALAWGDRPAVMAATLGLGIIAGAVACYERRPPVAWLSAGLAVLGLRLAPEIADVVWAWQAAWVILGMLALILVGWGLERLNGAHWRQPSSFGPLGMALFSLTEIADTLIIGGDLPALTFALASMGLLLATLAVRLRQIVYAYAAGAALVATGMCQLADWGVREIQGYVLPAGIYLMALAAGLRRFQGRRRASQVIEAGAAMLLLGATFGQALREGGVFYELLLCGEALLAAAYGVLLRLRVPFLAGVSFFVAGVLWMVVENVQITNQWVLFGMVGLLMIAAYVLLERYQERLMRAGQAWANQLRSWS